MAEPRDSALAMLKLYVQGTADPVLSGDELDDLIDGALRAGVWTATHLYNAGDFIYPTVRNGRRYKAVRGGTSAGVEPNWNSAYSAPLASYGMRLNPGLTIADGTAVIWQDDGEDYGAQPYDVRLAVYRGWLLKAAKASECVNFSADGVRVDASEKQKQCMAMADRFRPIGIA